MPTPTPRSGLARALDPRLPSNRLALAGFAAALLARLAQGDARGAVPAGLGTMLAWAAARELHPDDPEAAAFALALEFPVAISAPPDAPTAFLHVSALRAVAGTTGVPLGGPDALALAVLAAWSLAGARREGRTPAAWPALLAIALSAARATPSPVASATDTGGGRVETRRVAAARALAVGALAAAALAGPGQVRRASPLLAAWAAVALRRRPPPRADRPG